MFTTNVYENLMPLSSLLLCLLLLEYKNMGLVEHKQTLAGQCLWYDHFYVFNTSFRDCVCCVFEIYVTSAEPDGNVLEVWVTQHTNHSSKYLLENQLSFFLGGKTHGKLFILRCFQRVVRIDDGWMRLWCMPDDLCQRNQWKRKWMHLCVGRSTACKR